MAVLRGTAPSIVGHGSEKWSQYERVQILLAISGIIELLKYLECIFDAIELDAGDDSLKATCRDDLFRVIRSIYDDQAFVESELHLKMRESLALISEGESQRAMVNALSERETQVLQNVAWGASNKQTADNLSISESTVKTHVTKIFQKLNANDRTEAVTKALRLGIIKL